MDLEGFVIDALERLPAPFRDQLGSVAIVIEDEASPAQLASVGARPVRPLPGDPQNQALGRRGAGTEQDHHLSRAADARASRSGHAGGGGGGDRLPRDRPSFRYLRRTPRGDQARRSLISWGSSASRLTPRKSSSRPELAAFPGTAGRRTMNRGAPHTIGPGRISCTATIRFERLPCEALARYDATRCRLHRSRRAMFPRSVGSRPWWTREPRTWRRRHAHPFPGTDPGRRVVHLRGRL